MSAELQKVLSPGRSAEDWREWGDPVTILFSLSDLLWGLPRGPTPLGARGILTQHM